MAGTTSLGEKGHDTNLIILPHDFQFKIILVALNGSDVRLVCVKAFLDGVCWQELDSVATSSAIRAFNHYIPSGTSYYKNTKMLSKKWLKIVS